MYLVLKCNFIMLYLYRNLCYAYNKKYEKVSFNQVNQINVDQMRMEYI